MMSASIQLETCSTSSDLFSEAPLAPISDVFDCVLCADRPSHDTFDSVARHLEEAHTVDRRKAWNCENNMLVAKRRTTAGGGAANRAYKHLECHLCGAKLQRNRAALDKHLGGGGGDHGGVGNADDYVRSLAERKDFLSVLSDAAAVRLDPTSNKARILAYAKVRSTFDAAVDCATCKSRFEGGMEAARHAAAATGHVLRLPEAHECRVCGERMPASAEVVYAHVQASHGINLLQYFKLFYEARTWNAASLFKCLECKSGTAFEGTDDIAFQAHLHRVHGRSLAAYSEAHGSSAYARSIIRCVFCHAPNVRHANAYLRAHSKRCPAWIGMGAFVALWTARMRGETVDLEPHVPKRMQPKVALLKDPGLDMMATATEMAAVDPDSDDAMLETLGLNGGREEEDEENSDVEMMRLLEKKSDAGGGVESDSDEEMMRLLEASDKSNNNDSDEEMMRLLQTNSKNRAVGDVDSDEEMMEVLKMSEANNAVNEDNSDEEMMRVLQISDAAAPANGDAEENSDEEMMRLLKVNGTAAAVNGNEENSDEEMMKILNDGGAGNNGEQEEEEEVNSDVEMMRILNLERSAAGGRQPVDGEEDSDQEMMRVLQMDDGGKANSGLDMMKLLDKQQPSKAPEVSTSKQMPVKTAEATKKDETENKKQKKRKTRTERQRAKTAAAFAQDSSSDDEEATRPAKRRKTVALAKPTLEEEGPTPASAATAPAPSPPPSTADSPARGGLRLVPISKLTSSPAKKPIAVTNNNVVMKTMPSILRPRPTSQRPAYLIPVGGQPIQMPAMPAAATPRPPPQPLIFHVPRRPAATSSVRVLQPLSVPNAPGFNLVPVASLPQQNQAARPLVGTRLRLLAPTKDNRIRVVASWAKNSSTNAISSFNSVPTTTSAPNFLKVVAPAAAPSPPVLIDLGDESDEHDLNECEAVEEKVELSPRAIVSRVLNDLLLSLPLK